MLHEKLIPFVENAVRLPNVILGKIPSTFQMIRSKEPLVAESELLNGPGILVFFLHML